MFALFIHLSSGAFNHDDILRMPCGVFFRYYENFVDIHISKTEKGAKEVERKKQKRAQEKMDGSTEDIEKKMTRIKVEMALKKAKNN